jgi:hypothetical protein
MQKVHIKVFTERNTLINQEIIYSFINENFKTLVKHSQNGMTYLKLEGLTEKFNEFEKLIEDGKGSRKTGTSD